MKFRLFLLAFTVLLAACSGRDKGGGAASLVAEPFHMTYYDTRQPSVVHDGGTFPEISFGFSGRFKQIPGDNLHVRWKGKIELPKDGNITVQRSSDKAAVKIDGNPVRFENKYSWVALAKGKHDVEVEYEPKWFADELIVNFLPAGAMPVPPAILASDAGFDRGGVVRYVDLKQDVRPLPDNATREEMEAFLNEAVPVTGTLPVPDGRGQILILNAGEPLNVVLRPAKGADIKAVIATYNIGTVQGTDAPVYRVLKQLGSEWFPSCYCTDGVDFFCKGSESGKELGNYREVKAFSQMLLGKTPDFFHSKLLGEHWINAGEADRLQIRLLAEYEEGKARCGGSKALTFDNAIANGVKGRSWFGHMGGSVPQQGFEAHYFKHDNIGRNFAGEHVPHIAINYPYSEPAGYKDALYVQKFLDIDAGNFAALWVGDIHVPQDTVMDMQYDLNTAQLRVWVDGAIVHEHREKTVGHGGRFDLRLSKGVHRLEVEYINHGHTVSFAMHPQPKLQSPQDEAAGRLLNNLAYAVVKAEVSKSERRDGSLPVELPSAGKPVVLVLKSDNSVFWQVQTNGTPLKAVIIEDGKGVVSGTDAPVYRVSAIPDVPGISASYHSATGISAGNFK